MKTKLLCFLLGITFFTLYSCSNISSYAMVGESKEKVNSYIDTFGAQLPRGGGVEFKKIAKGDTLGFMVYDDLRPMETIFLFKDDECYYQTLNIYCSPCADDMTSRIINDKRYKFNPDYAIGLRYEG